MNILMIGPDTAVKGGISSVIRAIKESDFSKQHTIRYLSSYLDYPSKLRKLIKGVKAYFLFIHHILKDRPELVHIHTSFGASFYRKAVFFVICRLFRIRFINHIHGAEFDSFYTHAGCFKKRLIKRVYCLASHTIVLSRSWLISIKGIIGDRPVSVLGNFSVLEPDPKAYQSRSNMVLYMGEIGKRKGAYDLPGIMERVIRECPDVHFNICGNGDINALKSILEARRLDAYATLPGWTVDEAKKRYLNDARVFLLPSYNEGQPMAILEAMAYRIPVVSTTVGGIPELVVNGENGFISEPGNTEKMAADIILLLKNRELAASISSNNRRCIEEAHSLAAYLERLNSIYLNIDINHPCIPCEGVK